MSLEATVDTSEVVEPVVINLGKRTRKQIKAIRKGKGALMEEVAAAVAEVRRSLGGDGRGQVLLPIVMLYKEKRKRARGLSLPFSL